MELSTSASLSSRRTLRRGIEGADGDQDGVRRVGAEERFAVAWASDMRDPGGAMTEGGGDEGGKEEASPAVDGRWRKVLDNDESPIGWGLQRRRETGWK